MRWYSDLGIGREYKAVRENEIVLDNAFVGYYICQWVEKAKLLGVGTD